MMKVFSRLGLEIQSAVKDIPSDLKAVIDKNYNFKNFISDIYRYTKKDLNELEMGADTFTKTTKLREKDIVDIVKNNDKILLLEIFDNGYPKGLAILTKGYTDYFLSGERNNGLYLNSKNKTINLLGKRNNVIYVLNAPEITYKAWIIDLSKAKSTQDLMEQRRKAQEGILRRYEDSYLRRTDKSGYAIDPNKYKKMLKELKTAGNVYMDEISEITTEFFDLQKELNKNPKVKEKMSLSWDTEEFGKALSRALFVSVDKYSSPDEVKRAIKSLKGRLKSLTDSYQKYKNELVKKD